ncbi:queuosine 5'-phosphate N-glycosylase/hydrolase-like [Rhopilema esculentum]|uniref:queuosine 5'-phosphate N-glycosylase/hydrolase-like n=1 Tax=Rhopilema esculentum TaxID=499914 RepID=UPI0031D4F7D9|eukprot:gene2470-18129_t
MDVLSPRESAKFIAARSKHVEVVYDEIQSASEVILKRMTEAKYSMKTWKSHKMHPKAMDDDALQWIFVVDCLNFSFWVYKDKEPYAVEYNGEVYNDYEALCAVVNRALEEDVPITTPEYYKSLTVEDARRMFRSANETELPLIERRVAHLREAGEILSKHFDNSVGNLISTCNKSAVTLVRKIVSMFSSFRDEAFYNGKHVSFYKRAQIFVADVWACFEGEKYGHFNDITELTMFADYRVPQCLQFLGILRYSADLQQKIEKEEEVQAGSEEEVELRGCSIHAVECLLNTMNKNGNINGGINFGKSNLNSIIIDYYLWDYATMNSDKMMKFPEHRTRTHFY